MAARVPQSNGNGNGNGNGQAAGPRPRILRIGILLGGKIVEERLIREHVPVSIGQSMKNTFSIPVEGLPLELTLFAMENGRYFLRFLAKMDGRLSDGGNVATLSELQARAQRIGDAFQVPLTPTARGKLSIGDLTVLFQFVTEPPRQPRPMLPASVRGTFADRLDPRLMVILGASIVIHFSFAIAALVRDVDTNNSIADRAYNLTFKPDEFQDVKLEPPKETPADAGSAVQKPAEKTEKATPKPQPKDSGTPHDAKAEVTVQEENARAMADLLTGENDNGTSEGDMSKRRPGADLGTEIENVRDKNETVAVGGGGGHGPRGDDTRHIGTGGGPNIHGPGGTETAGGQKVERAPSGRITVADKQSFDESSLTPDIVLSKIQSVYMAQIQRCYVGYLKKDASARGKITLKLTVNETGHAVSTSAGGFNSEVDSCVTNLMSSWRFPAPKDKDGEVTSASFALSLQLVPD